MDPIGNGARGQTVTAQGTDYAALFSATPSPVAVLDPDLVILDVNQAYLDASGRERGALIGRFFFDAFPTNPADPESSGARALQASMRRVLVSRKPETMAVLKYDMPIAGSDGEFEERWWTVVNTPVLGPGGHVAWILLRVEDVTEFVRAHATSDQPPSTRQLTERESEEAELYGRARGLQRRNEELREAHDREREVGIALQEAMLTVPDLDRHPGIAVRYLPATASLNVCGDWYDVVDLTEGRFSVAVGDVVGHGLSAAATMGMLRSALSAAIRAVERPAQALEVLGLYARSVEGALNTTAVKIMVDPLSHSIIYSSAGHPPPVLMHSDGGHELLDRATDPPLGARPAPLPRPQAILEYNPGDTLVLYTDGLIERRGEDIDAGLTRLTDVLRRNRTLDSRPLADALLTQLGVASGAPDDIALVIVRL